MPDLATSDYPNAIAEIPSDFDLIDVSKLISVGPNVYRSDRMEYQEIKGVTVVAELLAQDLGPDTIGDNRVFTWRCTDKICETMMIHIKGLTDGGSGNALHIKIGSSIGGDEIMREERILGMATDKNYKFFVFGLDPNMDSTAAADDYHLTITAGSANALTADIRILATHRDA